MRGVAAGVYGYLLYLAQRDPKLFAFPSLETIRRNAVPYALLESRDSYSRRSVFYALRILQRGQMIVCARKFRRSATLHGWIVLPHDAWCVGIPGFCGMLLPDCQNYRDYLLDGIVSGRTERARSSYCWRRFKRDPLSPVWGGPLSWAASSEHTRALTVA